MQYLNHHPINRHYQQLRLSQLRRALATVNSTTTDRATTTTSTAGIAESIESMIKRCVIL